MPNFQRRDGQDPERLKSAVVDQIRQGATVNEALAVVGRSRSWYEKNRSTDRDWAGLLDKVRTHVQDPDLRAAQVGGFSEFAETYLGRRVWPHQQNMVDLLEGRDPSWLHPSMVFEPGSMGSRRLLLNVPPNHAKSMTITVEYLTYRVVKDPNVKIMIVSKTQDQAKKFLYAVKSRLTHPRYADMQLAFGPPEGWRKNSDAWTTTQVYLGQDSRDSKEKDPTLEAVGMGGQIYGSRADLIVLDDVVTLSNVAQWEQQMTWIQQEVTSRLGTGQLLVVGTRMGSVDLYRELRNPDHYTDGRVTYTYLAMPAVLRYAEDPKDWETLWPVTDEPFAEADEPDEQGLYPRWTGDRLAEVRNEVGPQKWALVYQQQDVEEDATFDPVAVRGCVSKNRMAGPLEAGLAGHPKDTVGFRVVCSMDPAIAGDCAAVALAVDPQTGKRYVLDVQIISGPTPAQIRELIGRFTDRYKPSTWVIEENAFQGYLAQDEVLRSWMASRGITMRPHQTNANKKDPDYGVASMSGLFGTVRKDGPFRQSQGDGLIELPRADSFGMKQLIEQLVTWSPNVKTKHRKQDAVMALWFAELQARDWVLRGEKFGGWHMQGNSFLSPRDKRRQMVVNLDEWAESRQLDYV